MLLFDQKKCGPKCGFIKDVIVNSKQMAINKLSHFLYCARCNFYWSFWESFIVVARGFLLILIMVILSKPLNYTQVPGILTNQGQSHNPGTHIGITLSLRIASYRKKT